MRPPSVSEITLLAATTALVGCTGHLNQEDDLLGAGTPDLAAPMPGVPEETVASLKPDQADSHDRSHWTSVVIEVERRQVEVQPWFVTRPDIVANRAEANRRSRGEYPTLMSSLEEDDDGGANALEGLLAPLWAVGDLLWSPIRMIQTPPGTTLRVPAEPPSLTPAAPERPEIGPSESAPSERNR
jgi:hypothetical protein